MLFSQHVLTQNLMLKTLRLPALLRVPALMHALRRARIAVYALQHRARSAARCRSVLAADLCSGPHSVALLSFLRDKSRALVAVDVFSTCVIRLSFEHAYDSKKARGLRELAACKTLASKQNQPDHVKRPNQA